MAKAINNFYHKNPLKAYELYSVVGYQWTPELTIAEARELFDSICDKSDWRNEIKWVEVPAEKLREYEAAITFFHGQSPTMTLGLKDVGTGESTGTEMIKSDGYIGW